MSCEISFFPVFLTLIYFFLYILFSGVKLLIVFFLLFKLFYTQTNSTYNSGQVLN